MIQEDWGQPEMGLDLDFSPQLVLDARLGQLALKQNFQGANKLGSLLSSQIHTTKLPSSQGLADVKIA